MIALALLPPAFSLLLGLTSPVLQRRCRPHVSAMLLSVLALAAALATGLVLCVVAFLGVTELPTVGHDGHWSADTIQDRSPVPAPLGLLCGLLAVVLLLRSARHVVAVARNVAGAARTRRDLDPEGSGLVVLDDARVRAYAVPGGRGLIVLTRGLLDAVDGAERRAVVAHEDAHLRCHHARWVQAAELAAAADPLLRPVASAVRRAVECWADEHAVRSVGDRRVVARAIARSALTAASPGTSLGITGSGDARSRVAALLDPRPGGGAASAGALLLAALAAVAAAVGLALYAHTGFELAQAALVHR